MNPLFILFIALPAFEIFLLIKIGGEIGAVLTVSLIFLTAIIGIYFAKLEGLRTLKSGMMNMYENKLPLYEIISGASIAVAAFLLIIPGFITDTIGFLIIIPFSRKLLINFFIKTKKNNNSKVLDGEVIEDKKDEF